VVEAAAAFHAVITFDDSVAELAVSDPTSRSAICVTEAPACGPPGGPSPIAGPSPPSATADAGKGAGEARTLAANLALLAGLGVLVSAWILFYTDWFPLVGGILGLGGLFAWAAFLGGLLTEERKKSLQIAFERSVLLDRRTPRAALAAGVVVVLWASLHGSLVLDSRVDERGRRVAVVEQGTSVTPDTERDYLLPHVEQKRLVFTGWWGRRLTVKVSGLPAAPLTVWPLQPARLVVPASFAERLVLLVRLSPTLGADAAGEPRALVVRRGGKTLATIPAAQYRGEAVWVACDEDVEIPERIVNRWRLELARMFERTPNPAGEKEVLNRWTAPLATGDLTLHPGDRIEVALLAFDPKERQIACRRLRLRSSASSGGNVQELYLKYPENPDPVGQGDLEGVEECPSP
jgi:hypothetical protein